MTDPRAKSERKTSLKNILHKTGSCAFLLTGTGHLMAHFLAPKTAPQLEMMKSMEKFSISMPGTQSNLLLFHEGFSIMMGILLFSFGLMNLILYKISESDPKTYKNILLLNCVLSLISFILSVKYFFVVPVVLMGIATLSFFGILLKDQKTSLE
jgi:hypothetical protein